MRSLLAIPDSGPLEADLLRQILSFGFDGVRVDVDNEDHGKMWAQAHSIAAVPECFPIFLLFGGHMTRDDGESWQFNDILQHVDNQCEKLKTVGFGDRELAIEFGNEPDIAHERWKKSPLELGDLYCEAMQRVWACSPKWHCLSPSISNLDEDSLEYLRRMKLPPGAEIAFHRYPPTSDFIAPHRGFRTRGEEVAKLKEIARGAKLWLTEVGWSEISRDYTLSELEVAERMADEVRFWRDAGVESFTAYQLNSGSWEASDSDDHKRLSTYGFRRLDGSWKPVAAAVRDAAQEVA